MMNFLKRISKSNVRLLNNTIKPYLRTYSAAAVIKSPFTSVEIPDQTITEFVWAKSSQWDNLPALTCGVSGRSYTYSLAKILSTQGAMALLQRVKLKPGDVVGFLLPNIPEFVLTVHACVQAGLIITFANPLYTPDEIHRQFSNANVRCIVTVPVLLQMADSVSKKLPDYTYTINIGGETESEKKVLGMRDLLETDAECELPNVKSSDIAVLPYSSGTTGLPKGVMLTHRNLVANILQGSHPDMIDIDETTPENQETVLTPMPFFHIMGFNAITNYVMHCGRHVVTIPRFTPNDYIQVLEKYKPSILFAVPALLQFLISSPDVTTKHLSTVKRVVCGAAPASATLINKVIEKINSDDFHFEQGYGLTETGPVTLYTPKIIPKEKYGSCGQLLSMTEAKLIDMETEKYITTPNTPGELVLRGPQVMKGYLNNPEATSEVLDADGWLRTGDVVYYDEEGYFFTIDRTKDLIKVKGLQVSPTELELVILELPDILDAAVIGIPDQLAGEVPKAFVVRKPNVTVDEQTIQDYVTAKVAPYKKLAGGVSFVDAIPRNTAGKILRHELRTLNK